MSNQPKPAFSLEIFDHSDGDLSIGDRDGDSILLNPLETEFLRGYLNDRHIQAISYSGQSMADLSSALRGEFNSENSHIP